MSTCPAYNTRYAREIAKTKKQQYQTPCMPFNTRSRRRETMCGKQRATCNPADTACPRRGERGGGVQGSEHKGWIQRSGRDMHACGLGRLGLAGVEREMELVLC